MSRAFFTVWQFFEPLLFGLIGAAVDLQFISSSLVGKVSYRRAYHSQLCRSSCGSDCNRAGDEVGGEHCGDPGEQVQLAGDVFCFSSMAPQGHCPGML